MGEMALGYGSEFHLLRWMGRHRNEFDERIKQKLETSNIQWLDFDFDANRTIPDKEKKGLSFLENDSNYDSILSKWKNEWPQSGNLMNWDLVGFTVQDDIKTWILVEAKAHKGELMQNCEASSVVSKKKIEKSLMDTAENNGIKILPDKSWTKNYYQLANRIFVLDFLKRCGIKAKLINIYFIGDMISHTRKSPENEDAWLTEINKMKKYLNIKDTLSNDILDLFLDVDK